MSYEMIDNMFRNLVFTKVKVSNGFAFYYAKIQTFTADGSQYVILAVPAMYAHLPRARMNQLEWVSLQTRILQDNFGLEEQVLDYKLLDKRYISSVNEQLILYVKDRNMMQTEYYCNLPMQVVLLHEANKKSVYQYADTMDVRQALSTFKCIIKKL